MVPSASLKALSLMATAARVIAQFIWNQTGTRVREVLLTRQIRRYLEFRNSSNQDKQLECLRQLQIWSDEYYNDVIQSNAFAVGKLRTQLLVFSPDCRRSKELKRQITRKYESANVRVARVRRVRDVGVAIVQILRKLDRIVVGPIRVTQIVRAVLRNPSVLIGMKSVFRIVIEWNNSVGQASDSNSSSFAALSVGPHSDVFERTLAAAFGSTTETTVVYASARVSFPGRPRGLVVPMLRIAEMSFHLLLQLQLTTKCERLLLQLRTIASASPYSAFVDYLLGTDSSFSGNLRDLRQVVPSSTAPHTKNLVSHSQFKSNEAFVLKDADILHERFIVSKSQLIVTENGADCRSEFVAGLWPFVFGGPTFDGRVLVAGGSPARHYVESAVAGFGRVDSNWFHFIVETLPRTLRAAEADKSSSCILIQHDLPVAGRQVLRALTHRELIELGNRTVHVGKLYVAVGTSSAMESSFLGNPVGEFNVESLVKTREKLLAVYPTVATRGRRVFMLRNSANRRITNLQQLRRILLRHGFDSVDMSKLSLQKQIETMQQAEIVVAQGGAGITNLMFAHPGTRVICLVGPSGRDVSFWSNYLNVFGISSSFLLGRPRKCNQEPGIHDDYSIDPVKLKESLSRLV